MKQRLELLKRKYYECEKGNRWTESVWGNEHDLTSKDGGYCGFSGCKDNDHKIKLVKSFKGNSPEDNKNKHKWFKSVYRN